MSSPLKVALIGMGTVGTGVARILTEQAERIVRRAGRPIELQRIVVRDATKPRAINGINNKITESLDEVVDDESIDVAIQLIGGLEPARDYMLRLLQSGKHVVTANKALLCEHGDELFRCAREHNKCIAFEAAVAGGIPIISTVGQALAANQITAIEAILNGTSNYILTEMLDRSRPYAEILTEAQRLGYAEADPTMDVDGTDAAQKLIILTQLAFGTRVSLDDFPRQGIDTLELADLKYAQELGYTVKLLAVADLIDGRLEMHVQPTLVRHDRPIAKVDGPFNMIALQGDVVGKTWLMGAGAGQMPTASAVMADLLDVAVGRAPITFPRLDLWNERPPIPVQPAEETERRFYLRFNVIDRPHVFADIADILGKNGISLASIIQHEAPELEVNETSAASIVPVVVMTHRTTEGRLRAADKQLESLESLQSPSIRMPVAD